MSSADPFVDALRSVLADAAVVTDPDVLASHAGDHANFCPVGTARVLVRPSSTEEVRQVVLAAREHAVPVVPQGARTGLSGGANAVDGCLLLSTERLNEVLRIDVGDQVAVVQPGVVNAELSRAVAAQGLFYPPDPSSWESSTIGGNVATNAGGLCCVKYGVTADYVLGVEVVLGTGEVLRTGRRTVKGVAGYDLTHLFVGSEGTLGVVTEVTLALRPAPEEALTAAATFRTSADALRAAEEVMASGLRPSLLEFLDQSTVHAIQDVRDMGLPQEVGAMLLAQSDTGTRAAADVDAIAAVCKRHDAVDVAVASDAAESRMLLEARRLVNTAMENLGTTLVDDVAVPRSRLVDLLQGVERISAATGMRISCPGHVGDGNVHPTVVFDRTSEDERRRAVDAFEQVMALGLSLGGTITGEHGVGMLKRDWLERELGPVAASIHRQLRHTFDPDGILNPGKLLPGQ